MRVGILCLICVHGIWGCESAKGAGDAALAAPDSVVQPSDSGGGAADTPLAGADASGGPDFDLPASVIALEHGSWGLALKGAVLDGPAIDYHTDAGHDGLCRLLTYAASPCEPSCTLPEVCTPDGCKLQPSPVDAGDLVLTGFASGPLSIEAVGPGQYFFQTEDVKGANAGTELTLTSAGGAVPAFTLTAATVTAPAPSGDWSALLKDRSSGQDVTLRWSAPTAGARIYLRMTTGIATHGGISPVELECEGPDLGELRLPGAWLDALYSHGWGCGECGSNDLWRYRSDTSDGELPVQFRVQSRTSFFYQPGLDR